nr:MAG: hypothetical protein [Caudoviricetes sp.]
MDLDKLAIIEDFVDSGYDEVKEVYKDLYYLYTRGDLYVSPEFFEALEKELESIYMDIMINFEKVEREETYTRKITEWVEKE